MRCSPHLQMHGKVTPLMPPASLAAYLGFLVTFVRDSLCCLLCSLGNTPLGGGGRIMNSLALCMLPASPPEIRLFHPFPSFPLTHAFMAYERMCLSVLFQRLRGHFSPCFCKKEEVGGRQPSSLPCDPFICLHVCIVSFQQLLSCI